MCQSKSTNHNHKHDHHHPSMFSQALLYGIALGLFIFDLIVFKNQPNFYISLLGISLAGYHVIYEGILNTIQDTLHMKKFMPNVHILMLLATLGSLIIGDYREGFLLILIFAGAHFLEDFANRKSSKDISKLMAMNPEKARLVQGNGTTIEIETSRLHIGDIVLVLNGDIVPIDGKVIEGSSVINQASITGESVPVTVEVGDVVYGSTINGNGTLKIEVSKEYNDTMISKIIAMVSKTQENISPTATKIKTIEPIYVKIILTCAPIFYALGIVVFGWTHDISFYRTMVFLIVSSPCALAATDIPASLSAISNLARHGVLFKGANYLSILSDIDAIVFDKTGTLTEGKPSVVDWIECNGNLENVDFQLIYSAEHSNNHPLADAILTHLGTQIALEIESENILGRGIEMHYQSTSAFIGSSKDILLSGEEQMIVQRLEREGKTVVVYMRNKKVRLIIGIIDNPQKNAYEAIESLRMRNIESIIVSGDAKDTVDSLASRLGVRESYGSVMPSDKASMVSKIQNAYTKVAMVGDGVNDAPALAQADVGIAMGNGTDIAIDVSDAVLIDGDISSLIYAVDVAEKLKKVITQNMIFAMAVVIFLILMNLLGRMDMTLAVIVHEGSTIVVLLNGLRLLKKV